MKKRLIVFLSCMLFIFFLGLLFNKISIQTVSADSGWDSDYSLDGSWDSGSDWRSSWDSSSSWDSGSDWVMSKKEKISQK